MGQYKVCEQKLENLTSELNALGKRGSPIVNSKCSRARHEQDFGLGRGALPSRALQS